MDVELPQPAAVACAHPWQGRQVHHGLAPPESARRRGRAHLVLDKHEARLRGESREVALLELSGVARRETVHPGDLVALRDQPLNEVRADEARRSGDAYPTHAASLAIIDYRGPKRSSWPHGQTPPGASRELVQQGERASFPDRVRAGVRESRGRLHDRALRQMELRAELAQSLARVSELPVETSHAHRHLHQQNIELSDPVDRSQPL